MAVDIYAHDMEVDVEEEKDGRIRIIFGETGNTIVIWLDTDKAGKLKDYLSSMLEDITRRKETQEIPIK